MEALSLVASVFAVTTVALQSAKAIYETVSGIKNGPKEVRDLASAVQQLCHILDQVSDASGQMGDRDAQKLCALQDVIDQCRRKLDEFQKQFDKLETCPDEKKLDRAWKKVKLVAKKEDFRKMGATVAHYISVLGVHLGLLGWELNQNHKVDIARASLQISADSQILRQSNGLLRQIDNSVNTLEFRLAEQATQRSKEFSMIKDGHQAAGVLGDRLDDLTSMSKEQGDVLLEKLLQLQRQVEELKSSTAKVSDKTHSRTGLSHSLGQEQKDKGHAESLEVELSQSIDRLCSLASKPRGTLYSHEAHGIISDIEKILSLVAIEASSIETNKTRKRKIDQMTDANAIVESQPELDIRRMQGLLTSSQLISVNERAAFDVNLSTEDRRQRKATTEHYVTSFGLVSVQVKRRRLLEKTEKQDDIVTDNVNYELVNIFEGTVNLIPNETISKTKISTSFWQKCTENGYFSLKPTLSFCAIIPENSHIFTLVREGDLEGLIRHVQQGHASLTDCDPEGRTLLNYALNALQLGVSNFLIDSGADVDAVEPGLDNEFDLDKIPVPHLLQIIRFRNESHVNETELKLAWKLRRLLLNAGADPTSHVELEDNKYSLVRELIGQNDLETHERIFNLCAEWINLEDKDWHGRTLLLLCSVGYGFGVNAHCIKSLLDRGANVRAKDNYKSTCLHLALESCRGVRPICKDTLLLLVQAGADVYATDKDFNSVSDIAYCGSPYYKDISYAGHVWEYVLTACGYDAEWFREDCRKHNPNFEEAWKKNSYLHTRISEGNEENPDAIERGLNEGSDVEGSDVEDSDVEDGSDAEDSDVDERGFEDIESDQRYLKSDEQDSHEGFNLEQNPQRYEQNFERDFGVGKEIPRMNEQDFDHVMQDSNIMSSSLDHNGADISRSRLTLPGIEELLNANIWNQADQGLQQYDQSTFLSGNAQDRSPWVENSPNVDTIWSSDSSLHPQVLPSMSPLFQNNRIQEVEEEAGSWDTIWG